MCTLNDGAEFGRCHSDIYPEELELKLEHEGSRATFLNLEIVMENGKFIDKIPKPFIILRKFITEIKIFLSNYLIIRKVRMKIDWQEWSTGAQILA